MTDSTPPGVFVERLLDYVVADAPARTVTVRIYQPEQRGPYEWQARVVISGMDDELDHEFAGVDGVQALFEALRMAGAHLDRHPGCRTGNTNPGSRWGFSRLLIGCCSQHFASRAPSLMSEALQQASFLA